jgi:hypothetical protein
MATTIKIRSSGTANNIPLANSLSYGELAINYNDGRLFYKDASDNVSFFVAAGASGALVYDGTGTSATYDGTVGETSSELDSKILSWMGI